MDKKIVLLTLRNIEEIGNVTAKKIMDSILKEDISLESLYSILQNFPRVKITDFNIIKKVHNEAEKLLDRLNNSDINLITYLEPDYPKSFLAINDPPVFLFYSGDIKIASQKCVAIVGTRTPSEIGKRISYDLSGSRRKRSGAI